MAGWGARQVHSIFYASKTTAGHWNVHCGVFASTSACMRPPP